MRGRGWERDLLFAEVRGCGVAELVGIERLPLKPGTIWIELPRPADVGAEPAGHVRIGYAS